MLGRVDSAREQAVFLMVRGFMDVGIMVLTESLSQQVNRIVDLVGGNKLTTDDVEMLKHLERLGLE
jgi:hypothetical protein